ncbi:SgcJ/EcaC family oxidoreductase [Permianibacter aggregans]|nr:SgcJ/EcaC family oxidoreductase [Permianibacter aggregans]
MSENMNTSNPSSTVASLVQALNDADLQSAKALYTDDAKFIPAPGTEISGIENVMAALTEMCQMRPQLKTLSTHVIECGDMALYHANWQMQIHNEDGSITTEQGLSADVLQKQPDGSWRIRIDNPWGAELTHT